MKPGAYYRGIQDRSLQVRLLHCSRWKYFMSRHLEPDLRILHGESYEKLSLLQEGSWTCWPPKVPSKLNHSLLLQRLAFSFSALVFRLWRYLIYGFQEKMFITSTSGKPPRYLKTENRKKNYIYIYKRKGDWKSCGKQLRDPVCVHCLEVNWERSNQEFSMFMKLIETQQKNGNILMLNQSHSEKQNIHIMWKKTTTTSKPHLDGLGVFVKMQSFSKGL